MREDVPSILKQTQLSPKVSRNSRHEEPLGDRAAREGISRCVFLEDVFWTNCTDAEGRVIWRKGRDAMFGPGRRRLPLYMDSGAYRRHTSIKRLTAPQKKTRRPRPISVSGNKKKEDWKPAPPPAWSLSYDHYVEAILLNQPEGFMSWDTIDNNQASFQGYQRMMNDDRLAPFIDRIIPVYQIGEVWSKTALLLEPVPYRMGSENIRSVVANAQQIFKDPVFQYYLSRHKLIAFGGLVNHKDSERAARWALFKEIARLCPDHHFWGLGMASPMIINGLGPEGLLDRIWLDGTWWILNATTQRFATLQEGQIRVFFPKGAGFEDFGTTTEFMAKNLRALAAGYAGSFKWPAPGPTVEEMIADPEARILMRKIGQQAASDMAQLFNYPSQMDLWHLLGKNFDQPATGEESAD